MKRKLRTDAVIFLAVSAILIMGVKYYGYEKVAAYTTATAASETITAADGQTFSWSTSRRHVIICNAPSSAANIYVKLNSTTCNPSASGFDFFLEPAQIWAGYQNVSLTIDEVTLYADASVTVGTDIVVNGVN